MPSGGNDNSDRLDLIVDRLDSFGRRIDGVTEILDIIRTDQINIRREAEYTKTAIIEARALIPVVEQHTEDWAGLKPLIPAIKDIDAAHKFGKRSIQFVGWFGATGLIGSTFALIKEYVHFGPK